MAVDPATIVALAQGLRLAIASADDLARLIERVQSENREPTPQELKLIAARREDVDQSFDEMLIARGIEPGTGKRIKTGGGTPPPPGTAP